MSHTTLTVPGMDELPRRHDITIRVAKEAGHHPDPAAFAVAASRAAAGRNASIVSAHTAEEIICVVSVPAAGRPDAVAVALAVVADALKGAEPAPAPGQLADDAQARRPITDRKMAHENTGWDCKPIQGRLSNSTTE